MTTPKYHIVNANQAVAKIAYRTNEVIPIYPITPASEMSELAEEWSATNQHNIFGSTPSVFQMQSEAGVAGAMHGALQTGSLSTTFTASQGLLLMLPNMYKIAGELSPNVIHVATRSIATHALSVFGDHSDVMAVRQSGYAMLASASVQEAQDFALISQVASLKSKIPFIHFFDGFRTSHEISKIESIPDEIIQKLTNYEDIDNHRKCALNPNKPVIRGTAQGPDVFFQGREASNIYYEQCPNIVEDVMANFNQLTGRSYNIFEYVGHPEAEHLIISMASSTETIETTIGYLNNSGEKYGLIKIRLFRPFSTKHFIQLLPKTCKSVAVLDRTKEPGSCGEPLYLDVLKTVSDAFQNNTLKHFPKIVGGRYGLSSKEFSPAMVNAIFDNLKKEQPQNNFTVGINDDVTHLSLPISDALDIETSILQAIFYQDKNHINDLSFSKATKLIGDANDTFVQAYTEIGYKKSNAVHIAHLRINNHPVKASYLINHADFIICEHKYYLESYAVLDNLKSGGVLVIHTTLNTVAFWQSIPPIIQNQIIKKNIQLFIADFDIIAKDKMAGTRQLEPIHALFLSFKNSFNPDPSFQYLQSKLKQIVISEVETNHQTDYDDDFENSLLGHLLANKGNKAPVSLLPKDGTYMTGTSLFNPPKTAGFLPQWNPELCTQCGACSMACPQAALRIKVYETTEFNEDFALPYIPSSDFSLLNYTIQINPSQCNACNNCIDACSVKALQFVESKKTFNRDMQNWKQFEKIPEFDRTKIDPLKVSQQQLQEPLFKYSSGVEGCGEAPYLKLLSQLYGDRLLVANATGASSIFGGALPTTPWSKNKDGQGPSWSNSLFEDNAEFGLGFRMSINQQKQQAKHLLHRLLPQLNFDLVFDILNAQQISESDIKQQRIRIEALKKQLEKIDSKASKTLQNIADSLVQKSVWIVGGDGWAYDIGYGGIDHVLASGENVNILVLDNEVYDNTGGQTSKATPFGAQAKFSFNGKKKQKKDLGLLAMNYDNVYVASVAIGADQAQTLKAFNEAESFNGPSIIIAYCHSESHGINMKTPTSYHQSAVNSGQWVLYRNDPRNCEDGKNSFQLDSLEPNIKIEDYMKLEKRFTKLFKQDKNQFKEVISRIQMQVDKRYSTFLTKTQDHFSAVYR